MFPHRARVELTLVYVLTAHALIILVYLFHKTFLTMTLITSGIIETFCVLGQGIALIQWVDIRHLPLYFTPINYELKIFRT